MALPIHNPLSRLHFFKLGEIMLSKYGYLMLPGAFPDKATLNIDFIDESVVQCYVPLLQILL